MLRVHKVIHVAMQSTLALGETLGINQKKVRLTALARSPASPRPFTACI